MAHRRFVSAVGSGLLVLLLCGTAFAAGPHAYITLPWLNQVVVIDTASTSASTSVVRTIDVGTEPVGVAVTPSRAYVTNAGSNSVSVIDTATNTLVDTINDIGVRPFGIAVDAAGTRVYVANQTDNSVSVIDVATNSLVGAPVSVGAQPVGIAVHPTGSKIFVTSRGSGSLEVIDAAQLSVTASITVGNNLAGIAVSPDGTRVWMPYQNGGNGGNLAVYEPETNTLSSIAIDRTPFGVAVDPQGSRVYVGHVGGMVSVIDAATATLAGVIPGVGWGAFGLTVHPTAPQLWVAAEDMWHVAVVDTNTLAISTLPVADGPAAFGTFIPGPAQGGCEDSLHAAVESALGTVERVMRSRFHGDYSMPGATPAARLARLARGVGGLSRGHLMGVYHNLLGPQAPDVTDPQVCDENLRVAVQQALDRLERALQGIDRKFRLPGNGLVSRLNNVTNAVARLETGRLQGLYWNLR